MAFLLPVVVLTAQFLLVSLSGITALRSSSQPLRVLLLGWIWFVGTSAFVTFPSVVGEISSIASAVGIFILIWLLHLTELIWVENHIVSKDHAISEHHAAYKMLFNVRRTAVLIGRNADGRDRGSAGAQEPQDAQRRMCEERTRFQKQHLIRAGFLISLFYAYSRFGAVALVLLLSEGSSAWQSDLSISSYVSGQLLSTLALRVLLVADFILGTYLVDNIFHSVFALLFVNILHLDSPKEWPSLWGSVVHTTSIRNFWGKFWHKLVQRPLIGLSSYLLHTFGIASRGAAGRRLIPFLVFQFSGIVHGCTTWRLGFRCGWWADMAWFCAQFVVIVLEDIMVRGTWNAVGSKLSVGVRATLGYAWTWGFLLWSIPKLQLAKIQCGVE